jgi:murein hydrolase activator
MIVNNPYIKIIRMLKAVLIFLVFASLTVSSRAQNKDELLQQRDELRKEIDQTEQALEEARKTTKVNMGQLTLINRKVNLQENIIENINHEIRELSDNIYLSQLEINKMSRILDTLKQEYAKSMVYAYKNRNNYDFLNFIFSSSSFNDAIKRVAYLKSYRTYREMQADNIIRTQAMLQDRIKELTVTKHRKNSVLKEHDNEMNELEKQQSEKKQIVDKLKGRQKELLAEVRAKRKQDARLKSMISAMIRREMEIARNDAAKKEKERLASMKNNNPDAKNSNSSSNGIPAGSVLVSSEADKELDASFEKNKGDLPWPVSGYVTAHFGSNKLPGNIIYDNPGVTIGAKIGDPVKAVFEGEVTLVSYIEDKQAVFIKHGKYFTVYSNLASTTVQRGDHVATGQVIGRVGSNDEGDGQVDFILMKESMNVDPELWLRH